MLRSIVVPLDGTKFAEGALPFAEGVAAATEAVVHLVRVRAPEPAGMTSYPHEGTGLPPVVPDSAEDGPGDYLDRLAETIADRLEHGIRTTVLEGDVAECLHDFAASVGADLVVMATRARTGMGSALFGGVTDEVVRTVDLPVLAVPACRGDPEAAPPPAELSPFLVALDGSPVAEAVLPTVGRLAIDLEARVTLLHVVPAEPRGSDWERSLGEGEAYLDRIQARLRRRRVWADTVVMAHPSPAQAILEVADEVKAGMLALGTHGRGAGGRALLGSVARRVASEGGRPVLLRRP